LVDFNSFKKCKLQKRGFDTIFTQAEKKYYSDFKLTINYNKSFSFSKPFLNDSIIINGFWKKHDDDLSLIFVLNGKNIDYKTNFQTHNNAHFVDLAIPNNSIKRLPLIKVKNEFLSEEILEKSK